MKVLLNVVPKSQVVKELLCAINESIDRFSQDRSFDFRLVRIDRFLVPPRYEERYDDAVFSYKDKRNNHPLAEAMELLLTRSKQELSDEDYLRYAAVLFRGGDFGKDAYWGAYFYFFQYKIPDKPEMFVRLDCRENTIARDEAPNTFYIHGGLWLPDVIASDRFSLPWVLAWAAKEISFEGEWEYHPTKHPYPRELRDEFARGFHCFRSGLGEIDSLSKKIDNPDAKRLLRYGWACAAMPKVRPWYTPGVGQRLEKLFSELNTESK